AVGEGHARAPEGGGRRLRPVAGHRHLPRAVRDRQRDPPPGPGVRLPARARGGTAPLLGALTPAAGLVAEPPAPWIPHGPPLRRYRAALLAQRGGRFAYRRGQT